MNNKKEMPFDYFDSDSKKQFGLEKVVIILKDKKKMN